MKVCPKCDCRLEAASFHRDKDYAGGRHKICILCRLEQWRGRYQKGKPLRLLKKRISYRQDAPRITARKRRLYPKVRTKRLRQFRQYYARNSEKLIAKNRAWRRGFRKIKKGFAGT